MSVAMLIEYGHRGDGSLVGEQFLSRSRLGYSVEHFFAPREHFLYLRSKKCSGAGFFGLIIWPLRGDIIQLGEAVPEHFPFCRHLLPCPANFGALKMDNRAFCKIWAGKVKHPKQKHPETEYFVIVCMEPSCRCCRCVIMVPPPLISVPRGTTPTHQHNIVALAATRADVGRCDESGWGRRRMR